MLRLNIHLYMFRSVLSQKRGEGKGIPPNVSIVIQNQNQTGESRIEYVPDEDEQMEEDPDDDLYI